MIDFTLVPYVGARPITFDMSQFEVEGIVGPPASVETNDFGETEERRGPLTIRYSTQDLKVVEIAFLPQGRLFYQGVGLFQKADVITFLSQYDRPFEIVGFVVFLELGITLTGFHDNDESQKAITVFREGRWDDCRGQLTPL
jgi:hypothetical protein